MLIMHVYLLPLQGLTMYYMNQVHVLLCKGEVPAARGVLLPAELHANYKKVI